MATLSCGCAPRVIIQLFTYSMERIALASKKSLALLGFFPYAISFSQSLINADIFYLYDDTVLILKYSLFLYNLNIEI